VYGHGGSVDVDVWLAYDVHFATSCSPFRFLSAITASSSPALQIADNSLMAKQYVLILASFGDPVHDVFVVA
jgi:hypothetical protein